MEMTRSGVILRTGRYEACVDFYRRTLGSLNRSASQGVGPGHSGEVSAGGQHQW